MFKTFLQKLLDCPPAKQRKLTKRIAILDQRVPAKKDMPDFLLRYYQTVDIKSVPFTPSSLSGETGLHGEQVLFGLTRPLWDVEVHCCTVLPDEVGDGEVLVRALGYCLEQDMDLVHASLGSTFLKPSLIRRVERISRRLVRNGSILVASTGNYAPEVMYPACLDEWLAVGSTAGYSAKGESTLWALSERQTAVETSKGVVEWDGTSRTAAEVSGLIYRLLMELHELPPFVTMDYRELVSVVLCFLAKHPLRSAGSILTHDTHYGYGLLDEVLEKAWSTYDERKEDNELR